MLQLTCPYCGLRDETEFTYHGAANVHRPDANASEADFFAYVYLRDNPRGIHQEIWHHTAGCRSYLKVRRDTQTHEVFASGWPGEHIDGDGGGHTDHD